MIDTHLIFGDKVVESKAHGIRENRKLVYPKKFLQSKILVKKEICRQAIDDLKTILRARGLNT